MQTREPALEEDMAVIWVVSQRRPVEAVVPIIILHVLELSWTYRFGFGNNVTSLYSEEVRVLIL